MYFDFALTFRYPFLIVADVSVDFDVITAGSVIAVGAQGQNAAKVAEFLSVRQILRTCQWTPSVHFAGVSVTSCADHATRHGVA